MGIEEIFGNPMTGNLTQIGVLVFLIVKDIITGYLKNKLDRKDIELGAMYDMLGAMMEDRQNQSNVNQALLVTQDKLMQAFNNLLQNVKVDPAVKAEGVKLANDVSVILTTVAVENAEDFIQELKDKVRAAIAEDNELGKAAMDVGEELLDKVIEKIPSTVAKLVTKTGTE